MTEAAGSDFRRNGKLWWAGGLLGFALGGFFDGILLHQVLQWHHLLSGLEAVSRLEELVLWDGLFHALMYLVALAGLWLLWRRQEALAEPGAGSALLGAAFIGFGGWHLVDAILSHWLLGLHRIRMDSQTPLLWDLGWLLLFGFPFLYVGSRLAATSRFAGGGKGSAIGLVVAAMSAAPLAALPPQEGDTTIVLFWPGTSHADILAALAEVDGRLVWSNDAGTLWAFHLPEPRQGIHFYRKGALLVSGSYLGGGCLNWTRASAART